MWEHHTTGPCGSTSLLMSTEPPADITLDAKGSYFLHLQTFLLWWPAFCHLPPPLCVCVYVCMCVSLCVVVGMQQDVFPVNSSACTMQHKGELSHVANMVCQVTPMLLPNKSIVKNSLPAIPIPFCSTNLFLSQDVEERSGDLRPQCMNLYGNSLEPRKLQNT